MDVDWITLLVWPLLSMATVGRELYRPIIDLNNIKLAEQSSF